MKSVIIVFSIALSLVIGCITVKPPELPSLPSVPTPPGGKIPPVGPSGFDWQTLIAYTASILAGIAGFIRWIIIEIKHNRLVKQGKKDANRDGEEDKE